MEMEMNTTTNAGSLVMMDTKGQEALYGLVRQIARGQETQPAVNVCTEKTYILHS